MSGDPYKTGCNYVDPIRGKTECTTNQDCASNLLCDQGSCISACTNLLCGPNAFCEPENHAGKILKLNHIVVKSNFYVD